MTEFWLRYVTHDRCAAFEAQGWAVVGARGERMGSHGLWSCLMKWTGEGEPPVAAAHADYMANGVGDDGR